MKRDIKKTDGGEGGPLVTVVIPVKNGGTRLRECLAAVFSQRPRFSFEVLCVDSGSTDESVETIRATPARLLQIPAEEFGHGRTRNLAVSKCQSPFVAMLTQDAVPANDQWLTELIDPLLTDEEVAGVFGRHTPHPGCAPTEAYMLERHFASFGTTTTLVEIGPGLDGWNHYLAHKAHYRFFSDNNAAIRKAVWNSIPYPEVEFMEDQLWASAILEAGYSKVYAPAAVVRHSHNYDPLTKLQRAFDESRYFREYFKSEHVLSARAWAKHAVAVSRLDLEGLLADPSLTFRDRLGWLPQTLGGNLAQAVGSFLGQRQGGLPDGVVRRISLHHALKGDIAQAPAQRESTLGLLVAKFEATRRQTSKLEMVTRVVRKSLFTARRLRADGVLSTVEALRTMSTPPPAAGKPWWQSGPYPYLDHDAAGPRTLPTHVSRRAPNPKQLILNWVIPPYGMGGGGHLTIFRMVHQLEKLGHRNRIYVMDGRGANANEAVRMKAEIQHWYAPIAAPVRHLDKEMDPADVTLATGWDTAYAVRASSCSPHKAYFVQDYEPSFFPVGASYQLAEDTYRFGFFGITAGPWLEHLMKTRYGMQARSFPLAVEHRDYWPDQSRRRGRRKIFAYVRPSTARRAFEFVALALRRIHAEFPEVEIHLAGANLGPEALPVPFKCHGILNTAQLRNLFSACDAAICVSMTNYSLFPQEILACACPVVDVDAEHTRMSYPPGAVVLVPPSVEGLAGGVIKLLGDESYRQRQIAAGLAYVSGLNWEQSARIIEASILEFTGVSAASTGEHLLSVVQ